jgi:signal transduction histidine kinase/CheY-like chemotaxis protein
VELDVLQTALDGVKLTTPSSVAARVLEIVDQVDPKLSELRSVIECDPALTAGILRAANQAEVRSKRPIATPVQAITILGLERIKSAVLSFSLAPQGSWQSQNVTFDYKLHWRHALTTAVAARDLAGSEPTLRDEAYVAGLLQDIGVLAIQRAVPERYGAVLDVLRESGEDLWLIERAELGTDHMEVGSGLLRRWGAPSILWGPIGIHHKPEATAGGDLIEDRLARVLRVAAQVGKVFCFSKTSTPFVRLQELAQSLLGLSQSELEDILSRVDPQIQEMVRRFEFDIGESISWETLLSRANDRLSGLTRQIGQKLQATELRLEESDQAARAMRLAQFALESASREKTEFLANISHEIRTPMTAILGYVDEILQGGDLSQIPPHRLNALDGIRRNARHLLMIVNDFLDLSKIEAGRLEVERLRVSPFHIASETCSLMRIQAAQKDLELELEYPTRIPETIETDPTRLRQILVNIVGNAIKFSDEGTVRLIVRLIEDELSPIIQFEVIDPGIGMSPEQLTRVFEPFVQADSSTTRRHGGTGLGLAICKRLADALGGSIEVESELGRGSTFRVNIPTGPLAGVRFIDDLSGAMGTLDPFQGDQPAEVAEGSLEGRILLVEDSRDNQRLIRRLLERAGLVVHTAEDGSTALNLALAARERGQPFGVILMDMQMPVLDGYDATRALRRSGYELPIIALTAHAMSGDREKCLQAGCDDFVTKPVDRAGLVRLVALYLNKLPEA